MRILFLDDMKKRRTIFQQSSIGCIVDFAEDAQEAISLLKTKEYDVIYLDHDLAEDHYQSNEDHHEDGRFVARALKEMPQHHKKTVIVHSLNVDGRKQIKDILCDCFDVWLPEDFSYPEMWKLDPKMVVEAISKFRAKKG
jgi:CheY-like chemotaxis protein